MELERYGYRRCNRQYLHCCSIRKLHSNSYQQQRMFSYFSSNCSYRESATNSSSDYWNNSSMCWIRHNIIKRYNRRHMVFFKYSNSNCERIYGCSNRSECRYSNDYLHSNELKRLYKHSNCDSNCERVTYTNNYSIRCNDFLFRKQRCLDSKFS